MNNHNKIGVLYLLAFLFLASNQIYTQPYSNERSIFSNSGGFSSSGLVNNYSVLGESIVSNSFLNIVGIKDNELPNIPIKYKLFQNYPNPFNPTTIIAYAVPVNSFVQIKVYDLLGREVVALVSKSQSAGYYDVSFNAIGLSSGIYIYKIQAGNFIDIKKMLLLR